MPRPSPLVLQTDFDPQTGQAIRIAPGIVRVTAPNASPYTFTGTNSFLIGHERVAIVDPGPDDEQHLEALIEAVQGRPVEAIILTHTHKDHCALVSRLRARTGAPLWFEGKHRLSRPRRWYEYNGVSNASDWTLVPDRVLAHGAHVKVGGVDLEIIATPGHCSNHIALGVYDTPYLLTGDHIMGWSSTMVSTPDGSMGDYLPSLNVVLALPYRHYLPAHGGPIMEGPEYARMLKAHREARNGQILEAVAEGDATLNQLLKRIYPALKPGLRGAARMTLVAHLEYLAGRGAIRVKQRLWDTRVSAGKGDAA